MSAIENTPLDELQWKSPEWVNAFGLRTDNVLEYFSQSPFFDRTSNNQVLKMQNQFIDANYANRPYTMLLEDLKRMRGLEFVISMVREPDFWVIRKETRSSETEVSPIADYYIIGASVYMAPAIYPVLSSRLLSTSLSLRKGISQLQGSTSFSPSRGHFYEFDKTEEKESEDVGEDGFRFPDSSASVFSNLLNISLQKNSVYLDQMPETGVTEVSLAGPTRQ